MITSSGLSVLGSDQLRAFQTEDLRAISTASIGGFNSDQFGFLTTDQVQALSTAQIAQLSTTQLRGFSSDDMVALTTVQVGAITANQAKGLGTDQLAALESGDIKFLTTGALRALTSTQLDGLTSDQLRALTSTQINSLTTAQVRSLNTDDLNTLTSDQFNKLSTAQVQALSTSQLSNLTTDSLNAMGSAQFAALSSSQVGSLTSDQLPKMETADLRAVTTAAPAHAYGVAKRAAEHLCALYGQAHGLQTVVARCFAFVGPDLPLDVHFAIGNFIRDALTAEAIVVNGDGLPLRSYMHQQDLAHWLTVLLERGAAGEAYNVGSAEALSVGELAHRVRDLLAPDKPVRVMSKGDPASATRNGYIPNIDKAHALGLTLKWSLDAAIRDTGAAARTRNLP